MRLDKLTALFLPFSNGLFSIGGGYAVMPAIQEQVVHQHGWLTEKAFTDIITISQMTPGPIAGEHLDLRRHPNCRYSRRADRYLWLRYFRYHPGSLTVSLLSAPSKLSMSPKR